MGFLSTNGWSVGELEKKLYVRVGVVNKKLLRERVELKKLKDIKKKMSELPRRLLKWLKYQRWGTNKLQCSHVNYKTVKWK